MKAVLQKFFAGEHQMQFWKQKNTSVKRKIRRRFVLACWPDDMVGWLRIPSMITGITGILGVVKYSNQPAAVLLKSFNLPPVEFCWLMLGVGCTVYLLSLACWLFVEDVARTCRPTSDDGSNPGRWRSL
jgi:hypothetical protein